ncbi:MAG: BlaI/MecI/CopY family transcriptional regulator [Pirellulaceae bacterium]|jgi:predicted transcriptional regulator|nr:BlaI/MecI/CopY family transcriptional regulator [Pirellulaceae bacterium]HJN13177.1 BlaI/MecI/CopY family transcriptional regulator [Pirellulaceae bacterium]
MARSASKHPTDGELEILQILWAHGPASLGEICAALRQKRQVATTTVATVLKVMQGKGLARRRKTSRGFSWSAVVKREKTASGMVGKLIERVFEGSAQRLVAHLVEDGNLSPNDLEEIRLLVERREPSNTSKPSKPPRRGKG